jgi:hypothetical protein
MVIAYRMQGALRAVYERSGSRLDASRGRRTPDARALGVLLNHANERGIRTLWAALTKADRHRFS